MANVTISGLSTEATISNDDDWVELEQGGSSKKISVTNLMRSQYVGTVSQSGGTPTGAVIERGSNANGEYVKFADGTLICALTYSRDAEPITAAADNGGFRSTGRTVALPATYADSSFLVVGISRALDAGILQYAIPHGSAAIVFTFWRADSQVSNNVRASIIAIGRWF